MLVQEVHFMSTGPYTTHQICRGYEGIITINILEPIIIDNNNNSNKWVTNPKGQNTLRMRHTVLTPRTI